MHVLRAYLRIKYIAYQITFLSAALQLFNMHGFRLQIVLISVNQTLSHIRSISQFSMHCLKVFSVFCVCRQTGCMHVKKSYIMVRNTINSLCLLSVQRKDNDDSNDVHNRHYHNRNDNDNDDNDNDKNIYKNAP